MITHEYATADEHAPASFCAERSETAEPAVER